MLRHVFLLFFLNTSYRSLGNPVKNSENVSKNLESLMVQCTNPVLADKIKSKKEECKLAVPPYGEDQLKCLMFYDINKQLCDAVVTSKLLVTASDTTSINDVQDVKNVCNVATGWKFPHIEQHVKIEKVIGNLEFCIKLCGVKDFDLNSETNVLDTNFFCKYYKWGAELLMKNKNASLKPSNDSDTSGVNDFAVNIQHSPSIISGASESQSVIIQAMNTSNVSQILSSQASTVKTDVSSNVVKPDIQLVPSSNGQMAVPSNSNQSSLVEAKDNTGSTHIVQSLPTGSNSGQIKPELQKPPKEDEAEDQIENDGKDQEEEDVDEHNLRSPINNANNDGNKPKKTEPVLSPLDQEPDDLNAEGEDEIEDPNEAEAALKGNHAVIESSAIRQEPGKPIIREEVQVLGGIPEVYADEDDHFFPFFLTAVVMVVLIYVLYHNKNKVSKVILGLLVEGRQPGRRRNSRGHAYRRLDTLEHAMSADTAATPSKIIY